MGTVEESVRAKKNKRGGLIFSVLRIVAISGLVGTAVLAPNVLQAYKQLGLIPTPRSKDMIRSTQKRLLQRGLLVWKNKKLHITKRGRKELHRLQFHFIHTSNKKLWDQKWRILIFDIKEKRREVRDQLRRMLFGIGFLQLQKSVWVYPYDCEELITLLKTDFMIHKEVVYIVAEAIEG